MTEKKTQNIVGETEWIPKNFSDHSDETSWQRLKRKCIDSPFVPFGILATIGALSYGLYNFYYDRKMKQQYGMRARVTLQGLTIVAIVYSMYQEGQKRKQAKKEEKS